MASEVRTVAVISYLSIFLILKKVETNQKRNEWKSFIYSFLIRRRTAIERKKMLLVTCIIFTAYYMGQRGSIGPLLSFFKKVFTFFSISEYT